MRFSDVEPQCSSGVHDKKKIGRFKKEIKDQGMGFIIYGNMVLNAAAFYFFVQPHNFFWIKSVINKAHMSQ